MPYPAWLPPLIDIDPWTDDIYNSLYQIFLDDFKNSAPTYEGNRVWYFPEMVDGREKIFWHLTGNGEARNPDFRRCERLRWARSLLENYHQPEVLYWDYEEGDGTTKTYVWLTDHKYVLIMKKYPDDQRRLVTAYFLNYPNSERKMRKKYENRI